MRKWKDAFSKSLDPEFDSPGSIEFGAPVDPKTNPKTFVSFHWKGDHTRKEQYGIYKLEPDRITICEAPPGAGPGNRPTDFSTKDSSNLLIVFERVKDDKNP
jgi:hypothetical protein